MEHFLEKIVNSGGADLSAYPEVHYRFVRYSRGEFNGPAASITRRGKKITIKGSIDYEDLVGFIVLGAMPDGAEITVKGNIILFENPAGFLDELIPAERKSQVTTSLKKKTNYFISFEDSWLKEELISIIQEVRTHRCYCLLSFSIPGDTSIKFTVSSKPPNNKGEYDFDKAIKFCTGSIPNTKDNAVVVLEALVPEYQDKTRSFKKVKIENTYHIKDIEIPPDVSENKRLAAIRKGVITREVSIDDETLVNQFDFIA